MSGFVFVKFLQNFKYFDQKFKREKAFLVNLNKILFPDTKFWLAKFYCNVQSNMPRSCFLTFVLACFDQCFGMCVIKRLYFCNSSFCVVKQCNLARRRTIGLEFQTSGLSLEGVSEMYVGKKFIGTFYYVQRKKLLDILSCKIFLLWPFTACFAYYSSYSSTKAA